MVAVAKIGWLCPCGWSVAVEDPQVWTRYWGKAMNHQHVIHGGHKDGDGDYMIGVVDLDQVKTDERGRVANADELEVFARGLSKSGLTELFGCDVRIGKKERMSEAGEKYFPSSNNSQQGQQGQPQEQSQSQPQFQSQDMKEKKKAGKSLKAASIPSNIQGVLEGWKIPIMAPMLAWFMIAIDNIMDDNGNPYTLTPDGFARYCNDVFMNWHAENIGYVLFGEDGFRQMSDAGVRARAQMLINKINMLTPSSDVISEIIERIMSEPEPLPDEFEYYPEGDELIGGN